MLRWFSEHPIGSSLKVDIHSHLLPDLDDGVDTIEETLEILHFMEGIGYQKVITTPHVYHEVYPNTKSGILNKYRTVKEELESSSLTIQFEVAAEYFMDEYFLELIDRDELLYFESKSHRYVLVETGFYSMPMIYDEVIFKLISQGYTPVIAHPERYLFLDEDLRWLRSVKESGAFLQMNLGSLAGGYGQEVRKSAKKILKAGLVDFLGSDLHKAGQINMLKKVKTGDREFLNQELI